jgi:antitoxin (DNA-binding transcriptional repressor) of toxin-antitoxin stability system
MQVTLQYAAEHLADLAFAASRGEDVEISLPGQSGIRLVPGAATTVRRQSLLDSARGEVWMAEDWDSPETNGEIADLFEGSRLFPASTAE